MHGAIRALAEAVAAALHHDEDVERRLRGLLIAAGRIDSTLDVIKVLPAAFDYLTTTIRDLIDFDLGRELVEHAGRDHLDEIRRFFLQPQETYSLGEIAQLWKVTEDDVLDAFHDEIDKWMTDHPQSDPESQVLIEWAHALEASILWNALRPHDVELALGDHFDPVRWKEWRTVPVLVRLPEFIAHAIAAQLQMPDGKTTAARIEHFLLQIFHQEYRRVSSTGRETKS